MAFHDVLRETGAEFHKSVLEWFPEYRYWEPKGDRNVVCDMRNPQNQVGHQQRAFSMYWAFKCCNPLDPGIDVGSPRGLTPYCMHVDLFGTGASHPFYGGGAYRSDIVWDGSRLAEIFPADTAPLVLSNHSLEHMPGDPVACVKGWLRVLRQGGILAMVIPDNDHFDVLASDRDHKNAWGASDFRQRVLDRALTEGNAELTEYDTFKNHHSFNVVARKR